MIARHKLAKLTLFVRNFNQSNRTMFVELWLDLVPSNGGNNLRSQVYRGRRDQVPAHQVELRAVGVEDAASSLGDDDGT